jgi:hypothetical protein
MAIAEHETGSQTATLDTEHTLNTTSPETTDGVFQFVIDVANMARADATIIRIKEKCRSGDTQRLIHQWVLANDQADDLWVSPSLILLHGWDFTLEQTDGTGRAYPWSIRKVT